MKGIRQLLGGNGNHAATTETQAAVPEQRDETQNTRLAGILDRSLQLDALSYLVIAGLLVLSAMLAFMLFNSITPPENWLLGGEVIQLLGLLFIGFFVFYQLEQHSRLRTRLQGALVEAFDARESAEASARTLGSAHHAAEIMVAIAEEHPLERVVDGVRRDFDLDAASIIMDDEVTSFRSPAHQGQCGDIFSRLSLEVARTGSPVVFTRTEDGSHALAVPLHVLGKLRGVLCMWQSRGGHLPELEGAGLLARVIELGWESRILYEGAGSHTEALAAMIVKGLDQKQPGYARETEQIIELMERIGGKVGLSVDELNDLRLAAKLRDIGLIVSPAMGTAVSDHALAGAAVVRAAGLPESIEEAIRCHHMPASKVSVDCTSRGTRILGACASYVEGPAQGTDLTPTEIRPEPFGAVGLAPSHEVTIPAADSRGGYA